jgi:hypothetical protein
MPVLAEKRTVTGTSCLKCNALLTLAASALGTNLPSRTTTLAWAARCVVCLPNAELSASTNDFGGRGHRGLLPCVHRRPPLERSLPPSYAPRVLAFKLDLDAFPFLHRSCPCQSEQPSELFIFRVSAPDEGQHGRERSSGKVGKRCRGGSHLFVRDHVPNYLFARRGRPRPPTKSDFCRVFVLGEDSGDHFRDRDAVQLRLGLLAKSGSLLVLSLLLRGICGTP